MSAPAPTEGSVTLGGLRLRFLSQGSGEHAVLLVHGLADFADEWLLTMESLASRFRVLAVDLPGHGGSDMPRAPYTPEWYARVIRGFLHSQGVTRASLVGRSLGGGLCLQTALDYPDLCERLVLLAPAGLGRGLGLWLRFLSLRGVGELALALLAPARPGRSRRSLPAAVPPEAAEIMLRRRELASATPGWSAALLATLRSSVTLFGMKRSIVRRARESAVRISMPTLLLWGERDAVIPSRSGRWAARALPDGRLTVLPGCGHDLHLERPDTVNRLILEFLSASAPSR